MNQTDPLNITCFDGRQMGYGGICPVAHYCPGGVDSIYPIPCDNGTYADEEGLEACKICPQGKYSLQFPQNRTETCPCYGIIMFFVRFYSTH